MRAQPGCRLRAAQHQDRQQCCRLGRNAQHARQVMFIARHPPATALDHQRQAAQRLQRVQQLGFVQVHDRIAVAALVAAGQQGIQRHRIAVGNGLFLFQQYRQGAGGVGIQSGQRGGIRHGRSPCRGGVGFAERPDGHRPKAVDDNRLAAGWAPGAWETAGCRGRLRGPHGQGSSKG